ncbi:hypothetical protein [Methylocystis parvus]|uniref:hypothetical protein n=1 Tax=Methylocystis parvus TaxID=134 RepID=UPI003C759C61
MDDDDEYTPNFEEADYLVKTLLSENPRLRHRGKKGALLRQLHEIDASLSLWEELSSAEKHSMLGRIWEINKALGYGETDWWSKRSRRVGATSSIVNHALDCELLERARTKVSEGVKFGAALRQVVTEAKMNGEIESHIKRLRRKASKVRRTVEIRPNAKFPVEALGAVSTDDQIEDWLERRGRS